MELTILMPCLNEEKTLGLCIDKAKRFLAENGIDGEILVADNGSTDKSVGIAESHGARVENVPARGYGAALIGGCKAARGRYVIMGDADDSYDFTALMPFVEKLRAGYQLVMGNRFRGGIEKGAMPPLHRYLGNPVLSFAGRVLYPTAIRDFHCGLRGYERQSMLALNLHTTGMEYASEMVVEAVLNGYKITEVPTTLKKDGRDRPPHLRSWHDGWRHLRFLLLHNPNALFLWPGLILSAAGLIGTPILALGTMRVGAVAFGAHSLLYFAGALVIGTGLLSYYVLTSEYARMIGQTIPSTPWKRALSVWTLEKGLIAGLLLFLAGLAGTVVAFVVWEDAGFGNLVPQEMMRLTIPSMAMMTVGIQTAFSAFFLGVLRIRHI